MDGCQDGWMGWSWTIERKKEPLIYAMLDASSSLACIPLLLQFCQYMSSNISLSHSLPMTTRRSQQVLLSSSSPSTASSVYHLSLSSTPSIPEYPFVDTWFPLTLLILDDKSHVKTGLPLEVTVKALYEGGLPIPPAHTDATQKQPHQQQPQQQQLQQPQQQPLISLRPNPLVSSSNVSSVSPCAVLTDGSSGEVSVSVCFHITSMQHEDRKFLLEFQARPSPTQTASQSQSSASS